MSLLSRLTEPLAGGFGRSRNRPLLEAAMAGAALSAAADGSVSLARRHTLDQVLDTVESLRAFDVHEAITLFDGYVESLADDPAEGAARALRSLASQAHDPSAVQLLVRIAVALARADGPVSPAVKARVAELCRALDTAVPDLDDAPAREAAAAPAGGVIVVGNEKGGTGKSTTAMHLMVALMRLGHKVGSIDLDGRQGTLSRYVTNRQAHAKASGADLPLSRHRRIRGSDARDRDEAKAAERQRLDQALAELTDCRFVVIDTPGNSSYLSRLAHRRATILLTPLNDSFLDLDVLAVIDAERREVLEPSAYCRMVWEQNALREERGEAPIDWVVIRNRLAHIGARNTREMAQLLGRLAARARFRLGYGLSERVIFRELFYRGLTVLDLPEAEEGAGGVSRYHARQEVRDLLASLGTSRKAIAAAPSA